MSLHDKLRNTIDTNDTPACSSAQLHSLRGQSPHPTAHHRPILTAHSPSRRPLRRDIGQATARLAKAFGMRIVALRRRPQLSSEDSILDAVYPPDKLLDLMSAADYVLVATPLTADTLGLVSADAIAAMRPEGVLINLGRGPCVDEGALASALAARRIKGAALDVFTVEPLPQDSPLWVRSTHEPAPYPSPTHPLLLPLPVRVMSCASSRGGGGTAQRRVWATGGGWGCGLVGGRCGYSRLSA